MSEAIRSTVRVKVLAGGEDVVFVCRRPTASEMSKFLSSRWTTKRNKMESNLFPARQAFIDKIAVNIENAEYETAAGQLVPLNAATVLPDADKAYWSQILGCQVESWKDLIPMSWKSSAATYFEDASNEGESTEGN